MQTYLRRGQYPDDAESAYVRWRAKATSTAEPSGVDAPWFEQLVKAMWLAGWYTRGEVGYGEPDMLVTPDRGR
jgi:hypothetical protein